MKYIGNLNIFFDEGDWINTLVKRIVTDIEKKVKTNNYYYLGLSGGSTPLCFYTKLNEYVLQNRNLVLLFEKVNIFIVDERYCNMDNPQSNSGTIFKILNKLPSKINLINHGLPNVIEDYNSKLLGIENKVGQVPIFDLLILGVGSDGHTASLFPDSKKINENKEIFVLNELNDGTMRYTLTYPVLKSAEKRWFLIKGFEKLSIFYNLIINEKNNYPVEELLNGKCVDNNWFILNN